MPVHSKVLLRVHQPPRASAHDKYRDCLREDFDFTCVYCGFPEAEVGQYKWGGFEVEHFRPQHKPEFQKLRTAYSNLLWACSHCNSAKSGTWPTQQEIDLGYRFLDPTSDRFDDHLVENGNEIHPRIADDKAALYTIEEVRLNSDVLKSRRDNRVQLQDRFEKIRGVLGLMTASLASDPQVVAQIEQVRREFELLESKLATKATTPLADCLCKTTTAPATTALRRRSRRRR